MTQGSRIIFEKNKIILEGNFLGKPTTGIHNISDNSNNIVFGESSNQIIGLTGYNVTHNISKDMSNNKIFFHKRYPAKDIHKQSSPNPFIYYSNNNYLFDTSINYNDHDFSNNFILYFNYGIHNIFHKYTPNKSKLIEQIEPNRYINFSVTSGHNIDISFIISTDYISVSTIPGTSDTSFINLEYLFIPRLDGQYHLKLTSNSISYIMYIDYIYYNTNDDWYILNPFIDILSIQPQITINIYQLTTEYFNLENYFTELSHAYTIYDFSLLPISTITNNIYHLHYNNKVLKYTNIDVPYNAYDEDPDITNIAMPNYNDNWLGIPHNFGILIIIAKSLNRYFTGSVTQEYKIQRKIGDAFINSNTFTITYEILCNPYLCPLPALPNRVQQTYLLGSAATHIMENSQKIKNASHQKGRRTKFITKK